MKIATLVPLLVAAPAFADEVRPVETTTADTLVVVTPNPPVIVTQHGPSETPPLAVVQPPPAPPAAPPAPQNEDWSNVSHINGTVVPVGERNKYLYKFKKTNISIDPITPFFNYYDGAASFAMSSNVAVTGSFAMWTVGSEGGGPGAQLGVSVPIYFKRTFSGPFLEPGVIWRQNSGGGESWVGPEMLFGWQWMFDSGLNVSWAVGVAKPLNTAVTMSSDPAPAGYFRIGYNF
jgi:hypothetical protein